VDEARLIFWNRAAHKAAAHNADTVLHVRADELAWITDKLLGTLDKKRAKKARRARAKAAQ